MAKLKLTRQESSVQWSDLPLKWSGSARVPQPNTWVQMLGIRNCFCQDEALLLCQESEAEWVAWIPDRGEAILHIAQFSINP